MKKLEMKATKSITFEEAVRSIRNIKSSTLYDTGNYGVLRFIADIAMWKLEIIY